MAVIRAYPSGDYVYGTDFDDRITTLYHNNLPHRFIDGQGGDDLIVVKSWSFGREHPIYWDLPENEQGDRINGGAGNDTIRSSEGDNNIYGGNGHDLIFAGTPVYDPPFNDPFYWRELDDIVYGGSGRDTIYGQGGPDRLLGQAGTDHIYGGSDKDTINGGNGHDRLMGDGGNDRLIGGAGNDRIDGGSGNDVLTGGRGADTFVFSGGRDRITDFRDDIDTVRIDRDDFDGSKAQLFRDAEIKAGNAIFHLDHKQELTIQGVDSLSELRDDLFFF